MKLNTFLTLVLLAVRTPIAYATDEFCRNMLVTFSMKEPGLQIKLTVDANAVVPPSEGWIIASHPPRYLSPTAVEIQYQPQPGGWDPRNWPIAQRTFLGPDPFVLTLKDVYARLWYPTAELLDPRRSRPHILLDPQSNTAPIGQIWIPLFPGAPGYIQPADSRTSAVGLFRSYVRLVGVITNNPYLMHQEINYFPFVGEWFQNEGQAISAPGHLPTHQTKEVENK